MCVHSHVVIALPPSETDMVVRPPVRLTPETSPQRPIGRQPLMPKYASSQSARNVFDYASHMDLEHAAAMHAHAHARGSSHPSQPHAAYTESLDEQEKRLEAALSLSHHDALVEEGRASMSPPPSPVATLMTRKGGHHSVPLPEQRSPQKLRHLSISPHAGAGVSSVPIAHPRPARVHHAHHGHHAAASLLPRSHSPSPREVALSRSHSPSPSEHHFRASPSPSDMSVGTGLYFRASPSSGGTPSPISIPYSSSSGGPGLPLSGATGLSGASPASANSGSAGRSLHRFVSPTTPPPTQHSLERYENSAHFSHSMHHTPKSHTQTPNQLHLAAQRQQALRDQELFLQVKNEFFHSCFICEKSNTRHYLFSYAVVSFLEYEHPCEHFFSCIVV